MSELTERLSFLVNKWHGEEPSEDWYKWQHDVAEGLEALEAQEARLASMSKALTRLIDAADDLGNATNCGLADDAIAEARSALTPSLPK